MLLFSAALPEKSSRRCFPAKAMATSWFLGTTMKSQSGRLAFRFRLQTFLVLVTALAIPLGLVTQELNRERRKNQCAAKVRGLGGHVNYNRRPENEPTGVVNGYLRVFLGDKYFTEVETVGIEPRTAEDLDLLLVFPEMSRLRLRGASVTDESLERLSGLARLEYLDIDSAVLGERGLKSLSKLPSLRVLTLKNCSPADRSMQSLADFPKLNYLGFENCSISDALLSSLTQSPDLSISFSNCSLSDANLTSLHGARSSVNLNLSRTDVTEEGILAIREANPAWSVSFNVRSPAQIPQMDIKGHIPSIQKLPHVDRLTFHGSLTSDATLAALKDARSLVSLELRHCSVTDAGLQYLMPLQNLQSLQIIGAPITDEGVRALEGLKKLNDLSLAGAKIEGRGLRYLPPNITTLNLSSTGITDQGLAEIARPATLEKLRLANTLVSDEGSYRLAEMTSLRELNLARSRFSDSGFARLQRALPDCVIFSK